MRKFIIFFCALLLLIGCNRMKTIHIYTPDKTECVTIFNSDETRYIANGKHDRVPDTNFIKLDIRDIDPLGDALHICWNGRYKWDIVVHNSKVIESKLDTSRFNFNTTLPLDDRGILTEKEFRKKGCAVFDFYRMRLSPNKGAVVEY